jgi:type I restriction enzyme S subunit
MIARYDHIAFGSVPRKRRTSVFDFLNLTIDVPRLLADQQRIADVLDKADELRSTRRAGLAKLNGLTQSVFLDMFGDPAEKPEERLTTRFGDVLDAPLRNGVSPSALGTIGRKVLTLSAISGDRFDETAVKEGLFESTRTIHNAVDVRDFLICRGNGNLRMVGKGRYPSRSMPDVAFPDTMIAARLSPNRVEPLFLEQVWNSVATRKQIESRARTTNGTLKVNQTILEDIRIITPPLDRQRAFAARIRHIRESERLHMKSRSQLDALFASLQHRAFRGEL